MARAALGVDEERAESLYTLGDILFRKQQFEEAREAFERAYGLDPTSSLTLALLAASCSEIGDENRAAEFHAKARSLSGGNFGVGGR